MPLAFIARMADMASKKWLVPTRLLSLVLLLHPATNTHCLAIWPLTLSASQNCTGCLFPLCSRICRHKEREREGTSEQRVVHKFAISTLVLQTNARALMRTKTLNSNGTAVKGIVKAILCSSILNILCQREYVDMSALLRFFFSCDYCLARWPKPVVCRSF